MVTEMNKKEMTRLCILGSTGSIGKQTLELVESNSERFKIESLSCHRDVDTLLQQIIKFKPRYAVVSDETAYKVLKKDCPEYTSVLFGVEGLCMIAALDTVDTVVTSVVGNVGLMPTVAAVKAGKRIALANKETLVTAGGLIMPMAEVYHAEIIPVDSEHSAIFQSLQGSKRDEIEKVILTASGGPFRGRSKESLVGVKATEALKHPNWSMGRKISIDSATLMNKGLEVIEAKWLFNMSINQIDVVVHPESIVHSMIAFKDSAVIAQLGVPDMRLPIWYALNYPNRIETNLPRLDFKTISQLTFQEADRSTFPCLDLAYEALRMSGVTPTVLNAANEVLVEAFLNNEIAFYTIPKVIEKLMGTVTQIKNPTIEEILYVDQETRRLTKESIQ